jgi:hypothetical protein
MRPHLFLPLLLTVAAADEQDTPAPKPTHAPTPVSMEEIRKACPAGRTDTFRVERGGKVILATTRFVKCDEKTAELESVTADENGKELHRRTSSSTWAEIQAHAHFPAEATEITAETIEVPAGKFECALYVVTEPRGVRRLWFAKKLPGPPVKFVSEVDGKVVFSMTLTEHKSGKDEGPGEKKE